MIKRSPESLKVLASRSLLDSYFEQIQAAILQDKPDYAAIDTLMQPLITRDELQPLINSVSERTWRHRFWPMMLEMFKGHASSILKALSTLRETKNLDDADRLIKVQEILFQHLGHQFSLIRCAIFMNLFDQRCQSIHELTQSAQQFDLCFSTKNVETDFEKVIYTIPEYAEKYCLPYLATLLEAKLQFVASEAAGEDPCKAHRGKLTKLFEFAFYYGSDNILSGVFELLDHDDCLWLIKCNHRSGYPTEVALQRQHHDVLQSLIKKWHELLPEFPGEQLNFLRCLKLSLCSVVNHPDLQCLIAIFKSCIAVSVPVEGATQPELLTQRLFPLDITRFMLLASQMPFLDLLAQVYINENGFYNETATLFLVEFLKHHLKSPEEVMQCEEIFNARRNKNSTISCSDEFIIELIATIFNVLRKHFSAPVSQLGSASK